MRRLAGRGVRGVVYRVQRRCHSIGCPRPVCVYGQKCATIKSGVNDTRTKRSPLRMQIENIIKDLPLPPLSSLSDAPSFQPPTSLPSLPAIPPLPNSDLLGLPADGPPQFPSQLLQLKWQLFCVQKSQQELASAILQLSSMILANSNPQMSSSFIPSQQQQQHITQFPLGFPTSKSPGKRRWSSKERGSSSQFKYAMMSSKSKGVVAPCQCEVCQKGEGENQMPKPSEGTTQQTALDLYVSYFLNNLENKQLPFSPSMTIPQPLMEITPSQQQQQVS